MTPHRGNTILFRSSQHLPRLRLRPFKGFLSWHGALLGPSTRLRSEVPVHRQQQLTQTLIVRLQKTHLFTPILNSEMSTEYNWVSDQTWYQLAEPKNMGNGITYITEIIPYIIPVLHCMKHWSSFLLFLPPCLSGEKHEIGYFFLRLFWICLNIFRGALLFEMVFAVKMIYNPPRTF